MAEKGTELNLDELKLLIQPARQQENTGFVKNDGECKVFIHNINVGTK